MLDNLTRGGRTAAILATITLVAAAVLLYQSNVRAKRGPELERGGAFGASPRVAPGLVLGSLPPVSPGATPAAARTRSSFTLRPPANRPAATPSSSAFGTPALGRYTYALDGSESASIFGSRRYPGEGTITVHRGDGLRPNEIAADLDLGPQHEERQILAYETDGIELTFEAVSVTFGAITQDTQTTYEPPVPQIPLPLAVGARATGTSEAKTSDGTVSRVEDWTVQVMDRETIDVAGAPTSTWVVRLSGQSRPGTAEQLTRTRQYWFDPARGLWVKWMEDTEGSRPIGPSTFQYESHYTATLTSFSPA